MNDSDIEDLLRRYRPVGPPANLRARILSESRAHRVWPWASAAAALLASTLALHDAAGHVIATMDPKPAPEPAVRAIDDLTEMFGGDATARRLAEFVVVEEQMRRERAGPGTQPAATPAGDLR